MTYNITLTANHQSLTAEYLPLAAESVQYLTAKVVCETEDWTGREIKAMFGQGCTVHEVPVTGGEITAKQQLNLSAGDWCVWLVGNSARDGDVIPRITTNVAHISVAPTGGTEGSPFPAIPPTAEEQLRADMGNLADLTTKDKSNLVAAINEAAASGGSKDAVTYTPQTLTEAQQKQARTNINVTKSYQIPTRVSGNNLLVDGWAAAAIGPDHPSGFDIVASDIEHGALPYFVADDCIFLCTGIHHSAKDSITFVSGTVDYSNLTRIVYKNAYWESGNSTINIHTMKIAPQDIEERAQTAYFYVGAYGYIYGLYYEDLAGDNPKENIPQKYPFAVVNGKFKNAILPLFGINEETKQIVYARTDATPDGKLKVQGLTIGDKTTPFQVIDIDVPLYIKPADGIPKTDLAEDVQTSLAKADTAISLGLTSATPGQIIKVKTVRDGKPTEWEAVDMPGGGEWEKIADIELRADTALYVLADFAAWRKAKVIMRRPTYVSGLAKNVWCRVVAKNGAAATSYSCGYLAAEYGYAYWEFSAEVSNNVISSASLQNNNLVAGATVKSTQTLTPLDLAPTNYEFTLSFADASVIQDGDKVTVIGVRR